MSCASCQATSAPTSPAGSGRGFFHAPRPPARRPKDMSEDPGISIRAAEPSDIAAITEVMNQPRAYWGTLQTPFTPVAQREKRFDAADLNNRHLVAVVDGKVVGNIGLHREPWHRRSHAAS